MKVSTRGRKGNLQKTVQVQSNDAKQPRYVLKIKGIVEVIAAFEPDRLNLNNVPKGETVTQTIRLTGQKVDQLKITELVSSKPDELTAELIEEDGKPAVKVTYRAPDKAGRISARVTGKTNLKAPREILLLVFGQVSEDLVAQRPHIFFPGQAGQDTGSPIARTTSILTAPLKRRNHAVKVRVSSLSGQPFEITGVEDPEGNVVGTALKKNDEWEVLLMLTKKPKSPRGIVKILTDREDQPTIEVRYNARLSRQQPSIRPRSGVRPGQPGKPAPVIRPRKGAKILHKFPNPHPSIPLQTQKKRKIVVPLRNPPRKEKK